MDFKLVNVGIADFSVRRSPDILRTILGSCVGICLYDTINKIGGLAHIMLPTLKFKSSEKKYADTAIPLMLNDVLKETGSKNDIVAKIIGGAQMFNVGENSIMGEIGKNNIIKVKEVLKELNIPIVAEDVGGDFGRTIDFYLDSGVVKIRTIGRKEITI